MCLLSQHHQARPRRKKTNKLAQTCTCPAGTKVKENEVSCFVTFLISKAQDQGGFTEGQQIWSNNYVNQSTVRSSKGLFTPWWEKFFHFQFLERMSSGKNILLLQKLVELTSDPVTLQQKQVVLTVTSNHLFVTTSQLFRFQFLWSFLTDSFHLS